MIGVSNKVTARILSTCSDSAPEVVGTVWVVRTGGLTYELLLVYQLKI